MNIGKKKTAAVLSVLLMLVFLFLMIFINRKKTCEIEFAIFAGSNWGVAEQDSYIVIDRAIEKFEKKHPDIKVRYVRGILKEDYSEWLSEKILMNEAPDVITVLSSDFDRFASLGLLENLDGYMKNDRGFDRDVYYESTLKTGRDGNIQYALPIQTVPYLMFVNKTLLAKENIDIPEENYSFNDLLQICKKVTRDTDGDGKLDRFGIYKYSWQDAAAANGAVYFSEDGKSCNFMGDELKGAINFVASLEELNAGQTVTQEDFDAGNVAFMPLSLAEYRTYKTYPYKIKKYSGFKWDCISMPAGPMGDNISRIDSLDVAISSGSRCKKEAWEFLKFLSCDEEVQSDIYRGTAAASVLKSVMESENGEKIITEEMPDTDSNVHSDMIGKEIERGIPDPRFAAYDGAIQIADRGIIELYSSSAEYDLEDAMRDIQKRVSDYLSVF